MAQRRKFGFSLVELLVCVAIISILAAMYMAALSKARRKAEGVVVMEGFRQDNIGRAADTANIARAPGYQPTDRAVFRGAYRKQLTVSGEPIWATEVLCEIEGEGAFRAYWFTVIDPAATAPLEYRHDSLVAHDDKNNEFLLKLFSPSGRVGPTVPVTWEFLSTNLQETSSGTMGTTVRYSDGHVEFMPYPGNFPACRSVAELSHESMKGRT
jgi:prepilin-type N-terminal cleavage/methylation domain-containing protein